MGLYTLTVNRYRLPQKEMWPCLIARSSIAEKCLPLPASLPKAGDRLYAGLDSGEGANVSRKMGCNEKTKEELS